MKKSRPYIWYMLPGLIFYTAFMILPIFLTALISLTGFNGVNWDTLTWVGGDNYVKLFTDPSNSSVYWNALICYYYSYSAACILCVLPQDSFP